MAEPQKPDQTTPVPATVHPGGVESSPIGVPEQAAPEVETAPGLESVKVSEDLSNAGVKSEPVEDSDISQDALNAGVSPSMPTNTNFSIPDFPSVSNAQQIAKNAPIGEAKPWRATEWLKELFRDKKAA